MNLSLRDYFQLVVDEYEASVSAPLSLRRAILSSVLINNLPDRVFETYRKDDPGKVWHALDLPEYRTRIEAESEELCLVHALSRFNSGSPELSRTTIPVAESETEKLSIGDFMISLYNGVTVQAILVQLPDGTTIRFHDLANKAVAWWKNEFASRRL